MSLSPWDFTTFILLCCSELVGDPNYILQSRGKIPIKGLNEKETWFVEPANPDAISVSQIEDETPFSDPSSPTAGLPQVNQCWLVKVPSRTRIQKCPSPFSEGEEDERKPVVVDMVKPQAPLEGAWGSSQPSGSEISESSSETVRSKPAQLPPPATPRVSKVTPIPETSNEESRRGNPALFISSSPVSGAQGEERQEASATPKRKSKGKCVVC